MIRRPTSLAWRWMADAGAVIALGALAFIAARATFINAPTQAFYQATFGPAVMVAVGQGFANPVPVPGGQLEAFLGQRLDRLNAGAVDSSALVEPNQFQNGHRYLMTAVGYWWRVAGISWHRLAEVAGFSHLLAVVSTFALLRLFVPWLPAVIGAAWFAISPLQLGYAQHLRDFAKGSFVLALAPLIVALVLRTRSPRAFVAAAALTGALTGIGLGFKMDVAIMAPLAIAVVILFRTDRPWQQLGLKALALGALLAALLLTGWPVLSRLSSGGSNAIHVVLLGYSESFDDRLGIVAGPDSIIPFYSDSYLLHLLRAERSLQTGGDTGMPSAEYDRAALGLWLRVIGMFPADAYVRLLAAIDGVLNLAFFYPVSPDWPMPGWLAGVFAELSGWLGWGWLVGLMLVLGASHLGTRVALFATVMLIVLAGYPSVQFDPRHYFHLQALPIAVIVAAATAVCAALAARIRGTAVASSDDPPHPRSWRLAAMTTACLVAATAMPLFALRAYQGHRVTGVVSEFLASARTAVDHEIVPLAGGRWLIRWPDARGQETPLPGLRASYYLAEFRSDAPRSPMTIGLRYRAAPQWEGCAASRRLASGAGVVRFGFPIYSQEGQGDFEGIEVGPGMRDRLMGVYRYQSGPGTLPIELRLGSDWQDQRLFQRLHYEPSVPADAHRFHVTSSGEGCGSEIGLVDATLGDRLAPPLDGTSRRSADVVMGPAGIAVDGTANAEVANLVRFRPEWMNAGDALVTRTWVDAGSIMVGLVKDGVWFSYLVTGQRGLSIIAVRVPEAGLYAAAVGSADPAHRASLRFSIDRLGVVGRDGQPRGLEQTRR